MGKAMFKATIDDVIYNFLDNGLKQIAKEMDADVLFIMSSMFDNLDTAIRHYIEDITDRTGKNKSQKLCVMLQTTGGSVEVVERIVRVFRNHYEKVDFIVPNYAYSAGTVLVLSGDEIYMDYFSVLGPIDPQIRNKDGEWLPAIGYLHEYESLISIINEKDSRGESPRAEISLLVNQFSPEKLAFIKQSNMFGKSLIKEWLPKYKFKNWLFTETTGKEVTDEIRIKRADDIATILGNVNRWNIHGRGIGIAELTSEEIKLEIQNFADNDTLNSAIRMYYDVLVDYLGKIGCTAALHGSLGLRRLG